MRAPLVALSVRYSPLAPAWLIDVSVRLAPPAVTPATGLPVLVV